MKPLTDGERDILREQEQDVRGLEPDAPTLGDLYRAWDQAAAVWCGRVEEQREAVAACDAARAKYRTLEQQLGEMALADEPRENGRCRGAWVVMAGRLYHVDETGNEADGYRYEVRAVPVRKLAV